MSIFGCQGVIIATLHAWLFQWAGSERSTLGGADIEVAALQGSRTIQVSSIPTSYQGTCGSDEISSLMRVQEPRVLPWHKIFSVADIYIKAQSTEIQHLEAELASADAEIKAASEQKAAAVVNDTQVRKLITQGLLQQYGAAKSFGSIETAMDVKCGADLEKLERLHQLSDEFRHDDDLFLDYFDVAVDRFQTLVAEYSEAEAVFSEGSVLQACLQLLNSSLRDDASDCDELCTQLEMAVHRVAQPGLTRDVNLESARMKRERTWLALTAKQSRLLDCVARQTELSAAKVQLDSLDSTALAAWKVEKKFKRRVFRVARLLESFRSQLQEQHQRLDGLLRLLEESGGQVSQQHVSSDLAEKTDAAIAAGIEAFRAKVVHVAGLVARISFANGLQAKLTLILLQMQNFFDAGVRAPLKEIGITTQASYGDSPLGKFPPLRIDSVAQALEGLRQFCQEETSKEGAQTTEASNASDGSVQLCSLGDVDGSVQEVASVVNRTQSVVKYRLMQVQEQLWAGPGVANEPFGLSEVLRLYNTTQFAKSYLSQWKPSGNLSALASSLANAKAELQKDVLEEVGELTNLKQQLLQSQQSRSEFIDRLEEAIQGQSEKMVAMGDCLQALQNIKREEGLLQAQLETLAAQEAETLQERQVLSTLLQETPAAASLLQAHEDTQSAHRISTISAHRAF